MNNESMPRVLIVGAGPVGQMAALLLSQHGIPSLLVDKRTTRLTAPKAHAVNARTLEICDSIGISASQLRELGSAANEGGMVRFVGTLTGPEFGSLPYERQDVGALESTPFPLSNIPQPLFEQVLARHVTEDPNIDYRLGTACTSLINQGAQVAAKLLDSRDKSRSHLQLFDYAIAADGAGSSIRDSLDIEMEGPEALAHYLMIHFSADLRALTENRRGVLYFLFEPGVNGTFIAYDHSKTWVLMHPWQPGSEKLKDYTQARCAALIDKAVGQSLNGVTVENISPWTMTAQVAKAYRKERIFLAGDSAHRIPPAGGLGLNSGIGDVQNLSWKLAAVLNGLAGERLLDTYEVERQPIARINNEQSLNNAIKLFDLIVALHGDDPEKTGERYAAISKSPDDFPELAEAVKAQKPHFDSFDLQIGYRYNSLAIVDPPPIPDVGDVSDYQPSWDAGAHFPHRWVTQDGETRSLHSLISPRTFTLLRGPKSAELSGHSKVQQLLFGVDFEDVDDWEILTGLPASGALLIRPDGHIATRFKTVNEEDFSSAIRQILARGD